MNNLEMKRKIQNSIQEFRKSKVIEASLNLFQILGYNTDRRDRLPEKSFRSFKESFLYGAIRFNEENAQVGQWQSVDLLFQLSKDEMTPQNSLFDTKQVDRTIIEAYLFFAIELAGESYNRTVLSQITREINKIFPMPVMVLFKYGLSLTLAIINRRLHKRDDNKDVLEKVTLIKDISIENPHRAHIEILFDLSFDELLRKHKISNFVELHNAWQKTLDTKELNKQFFKKLANWYFYSQQFVSFPSDQKNTAEKNVQLNLIRLITRLIFVWFLKEKNLIKDELFHIAFLKKVVKNFDPSNETAKNYYPAILQNLFFATLNQKMNERNFAQDDDHFNKDDQGIKTLFRFAEKFIIGKREVLALFENIPFLNGGLFDCLDKFDDEKLEKGIKEQIFIDGFTRIEKHIPVVPDFLFFGRKENVDLASYYGDKKHQKEEFNGLIQIFNDYKFTIEENTPVEEEIALDPELLGKVFENLLAYYTPETETTARKQTGSFYTPREIVNYMVDESLVAYLKTQLLNINPAYIEFGHDQIQLFDDVSSQKQLSLTETINKSRWEGKEQALEDALRHLIHYNNDPHPFNESEVQQLIFAIDHSKILDPACGSGAFPMGVLHKLVYLLGKLDPEDAHGITRWRNLQKKKAEIAISKALNEKDKHQREQKLIEINDIFENNASDYGRKLYLIENCIYGVDIQPIAVQISKLRFFISLMVDQKEQPGVDNRGIRPLPNLETKFVAANTLIGLDKPAQLPMGYEAISSLQKQLQEIRHQHFEAKSRKEKLRCQKEDQSIRKQILEKLISLPDFHIDDAKKVASFNIYDQNSAAAWFEPDWMFGNDLRKGFDVVLGNPPYVQLQKDQGKLANELKNQRYASFEKTGDIYSIFYEHGFKILKENGVETFITSSQWMKANYGKSLRKFFLKKNPLKLIALGPNVFESAIVDTNILISVNTSNKNQLQGCKINKLEEIEFLENLYWQPMNYVSEIAWSIINYTKQTTNEKIKAKSIPLKEWKVKINFGIKTGYNEAFLIDDVKRNQFVNTDKKNAEIIKPILRGREIGKYYTEWDGGYLIATLPALDINISKYPAVKKYLESFLPKIKQSGETFINNQGQSEKTRKKTSNKWYETQDQIGYYEEFLKEKIIWKRIGSQLRFSYSNEEIFCLDSTCIATGEKIKYLTALLNSKLCNYQLFESAPKTGMGDLIISVQALEPLLVFYPNEKEENLFNDIIDFILVLKKENKNTTFFERLIDAMVYELYFPDEIKAADAEVLKHLSHLPGLKDEWSEAQKLATIEKVYQELSNPAHPLAIATERMKTVPEVRIIEGLDKK